MSSAKSVAKELVRLSLRGQVADPLTPYRLQCLLYFAQAWSRLIRRCDLFPEEIKCWQQAPVVVSVADALGHDEEPIERTTFENEPALDDDDDALFLSHLWEAYNQYSPSGMLALVQREAPILLTQKQVETGGTAFIHPNLMYEAYASLHDWPPALHQYNQIRQERESEAERAILGSPPLDVDAIWKSAKSRTPSATGRWL